MTRSPATIRDRLRARRHSALLASIVATFAVRPLIGDTRPALIVFSVAIVVLMLVALYTLQVDELVGDRDTLVVERRRRFVLASVLAVPALVERVLVMFVPDVRVYLAGSICWFLFLAMVTWSQLRSVLRQRAITGETISMAVSVYLLIGFTWGLFYVVLFQLEPHAFHFEASPDVAAHMESHRQAVFPVLIYFSLTTLSTIGFGDITPVTLPARYAAVAEGIIGQFYMAILVARLVSMHMSAGRKGD